MEFKHSCFANIESLNYFKVIIPIQCPIPPLSRRFDLWWKWFWPFQIDFHTDDWSICFNSLFKSSSSRQGERFWSFDFSLAMPRLYDNHFFFGLNWNGSEAGITIWISCSDISLVAVLKKRHKFSVHFQNFFYYLFSSILFTVTTITKLNVFYSKT